MSLIANPTFVIANGGTSVVTAILVEPAGTFVPNGTEVFFFTNLGRIDASGKTVNGVARVNFVSDARSGHATVTAISGGPAVAPSAGPTPTPTPGGSIPGSGGSASASSFGGSAPAFGASNILADQNSASTTIDIGSGLPTHVVVRADPPLITIGRPATIRASVFDSFGNPVQNVPVTLSVSAGPARLESGGAVLYTNSNGEVTDTLRATATPTASTTVTVTATAANNTVGTTTVAVQ
jgi:hypothetical protein